MKVGRRLAMKVLNASKFVLGGVGATCSNHFEVSEPIDCALLGRLARRRRPGDRGLRRLRLHQRLEATEKFFWEFCDDYLELVKERAYDEDGGAATASARATLAIALQVQLRLLAPFLPYVTEEVWSWWQEGSIHRASWPTAVELGAAAAAYPAMVDAVAAALIGIRGAKSTGQGVDARRARPGSRCGPGGPGPPAPRPRAATCAAAARSPATWSSPPPTPTAASSASAPSWRRPPPPAERPRPLVEAIRRSGCGGAQRPSCETRRDERRGARHALNRARSHREGCAATVRLFWCTRCSGSTAQT